MRQLLDATDAARGLRRVAGEIVERHRGAKDLLLVGIRRGGVPIAYHLAELVSQFEEETSVPVGTVDITLYRDDAATALPNPRIGPSQLPTKIEGRPVILVDDVLFTGRTIRAALDAIVDYGRPAQVELAVLVNRGGRELPIQADYRVVDVSVDKSERVDVFQTDAGWIASAVPVGSPSAPSQPKVPENSGGAGPEDSAKMPGKA